jgi:hypothetical protein
LELISIVFAPEKHFPFLVVEAARGIH